ncbi:hypothetical protein IFM89_034932 [Coptis chinensis]|uniref:Strictosidine synthase conserved region domain-containing protein n=1 Tax=Coptis chinensis TaxID=261450 RepID=A0A835I7C7_9MAGN|nr:hypothetical protein IFM89_034932 [Coptis chinensis]
MAKSCSMRNLYLVLLFFTSFSLSLIFTVSYPTYPEYQLIRLPPSVTGPESFAFDCNGKGPYVGVSDGRIFKWQGLGWSEFAHTAPYRRRDVCDGSTNPSLESICGRPLGLQFNNATCELYIADAYFGLMSVGKNGGAATQLASSVEGVPFKFTNNMDIHPDSGIVYFTDSSTRFSRREHLRVTLSGDSTGRLMKYDPRSRQVTVLQRGLKFANGVALSKDYTFVLVAETGARRVLRYWLEGPRANTIELFTQLPGTPDNIKRNAMGDFWVALNDGQSTPSYTDKTIGVRLDEQGRHLESLHGNAYTESVSEINEYNGGELCVLCKTYGIDLDIWVMKNYGLSDSWVKLFAMERTIKMSVSDSCSSHLLYNKRNPRPLCFAKSGEVLLRDGNGSVKYMLILVEDIWVEMFLVFGPANQPVLLNVLVKMKILLLLVTIQEKVYRLNQANPDSRNFYGQASRISWSCQWNFSAKVSLVQMNLRDYGAQEEENSTVEEKSALVYQKKKTIVMDRKHKKEQEDEAEKLTCKIYQSRKNIYLWQFFKIEEEWIRELSVLIESMIEVDSQEKKWIKIEEFAAARKEER